MTDAEYWKAAATSFAHDVALLAMACDDLLRTVRRARLRGLMSERTQRSLDEASARAERALRAVEAEWPGSEAMLDARAVARAKDLH